MMCVHGLKLGAAKPEHERVPWANLRNELASLEPNGYGELCVCFCVWAAVRGPVAVFLGGRAGGRLGEGGVWVGHKDFIPKLK